MMYFTPFTVVVPTEVEIQPDMTYGEEPIKILAREVKLLRNKKLSERKVFGPELIQEAKIMVKMIKGRLKAAFDKKKSYADLKLKDIKYTVGDKYLRGKWSCALIAKGKLNPRFIKPYEIIERVLLVAYHPPLSSKLKKIHDVFHVSMLCLYQSDPSHVILLEEIEVQLDFSYKEEPVEILT
ncbi:DNA/RNA polymerases superfamily protein [Gossypium australe]|uniref:DNA/RNA polymerases superfamily protein n=1 Tax=Gossypium australe TaxID=47621 RepID=A0A5B6WUF6_9ROSI|nr:DNA/RNA polymerases superfamily protein [Gossypium australe]